MTKKDEKMLAEFKDALSMFKDSYGVVVVDFELLFKPYPLLRKWFKEKEICKKKK